MPLMADPTSSPGARAPRHSDRIWSNWQARNPSVRLSEISGFKTTNHPFVEVTLDYDMDFFGIRPNATIREKFIFDWALDGMATIKTA
ncbi:hypothetical protein D9615_005400 [Tricholomella constricta]|uniref:Uncharacterized protein n=1 Tax=Tricholomella constricta TaxID=117010 RepID=A0A8H5HED2_9AGAR|nr:hypothetical protein D9615_005400 [Tricholomella constricta]